MAPPGGRADERFLADNPVRITRSGQLLWGGRIADVKRIAEGHLDVSCEGWQRLLDDNPIRRWYVHQDMASWRDTRSFTDHVRLRPFGRVTVGSGVVRLEWPRNSVTINPSFSAVTFDYGSAALGPKRFRMVGTSSANNSSISLYCRAHSEVDFALQGGTVGTTIRDLITGGQSLNTLGSGFNVSDDFNGGEQYRYVTIFLYYAGAVTLTTDYWVNLTQLTGYHQASFDGGIAGQYYSALRASAVFEDIRDEVSGLSSASNITGTSFDISEMGPQGNQAPRNYLIAANAYHDYLWGVDAERRLYFTPRPTTSALRAGPHLRLEGGSLSSTARNFNRVLVQGTDPTGQEITVERTTTNGLLDRQGVTRSKVLGVNAAIPEATAEVIGDAWLAERSRTPMRGGITATERGDITDANGQELEPVQLLNMAGQRVRLDGEIDPDTGELGRSGIVRAVSYAPGTGARLSIDDETNHLQTVLNRYAANLAGGG